MSVALEGNSAKKYIFDNTGLTEKKTTGTRVIMKNSKRELTNSIRDNPLYHSIYTRIVVIIIKRLDDNSSISVNGVPVVVPDGIKDGSHVFELQNPETYVDGYKVKHFGLYVFNNGGNIWKGMSYYRKGMKIGDIDLKRYP